MDALTVQEAEQKVCGGGVMRMYAARENSFPERWRAGERERESEQLQLSQEVC